MGARAPTYKCTRSRGVWSNGSPVSTLGLASYRPDAAAGLFLVLAGVVTGVLVVVLTVVIVVMNLWLAVTLW